MYQPDAPDRETGSWQDEIQMKFIEGEGNGEVCEGVGLSGIRTESEIYTFPIYSTLKIHKNQLHFSLLLWFFFMIQSMNEDWWKGFKKILNICIDLISENHLNLKRKKAGIVKEFSTCYWMNFEIFTFRILLIFRIFHISYHMQ